MKKLITLIAAVWGALFLYDSFAPPISTLMMARYATARSVTREYVPINRISHYLVSAVIAAEDGAFCTHNGVDWKALKNAVNQVSKGNASHGGSTITMQTVKNLFLWQGFSYIRKPIEVPLALVTDLLWSKKRIMENYLNIAEFGNGIFGAEAAARHYFGKSAAGLSEREAVLLATILPAPTRRNAIEPNEYTAGYAATIDSRMGKGVASSCAR